MKIIKWLVIVLFTAGGMAGVAQAQGRGTRSVAVCPVHGVRLKHGTERIRYGTVYYPPSYRYDAPRFFPYANVEVVITGGIRNLRSAPVWYCPTCRKVEREWRREYQANGQQRDAQIVRQWHAWQLWQQKKLAHIRR